jgi:hypothetical protein
VTPTLLAGDKSLADVICHEIAHSWTGNLVTTKNWEHFWLNGETLCVPLYACVLLRVCVCLWALVCLCMPPLVWEGVAAAVVCALHAKLTVTVSRAFPVL